jgi:hypothetical protein
MFIYCITVADLAAWQLDPWRPPRPPGSCSSPTASKQQQQLKGTVVRDCRPHFLLASHPKTRHIQFMDSLRYKTRRNTICSIFLNFAHSPIAQVSPIQQCNECFFVSLLEWFEKFNPIWNISFRTHSSVFHCLSLYRYFFKTLKGGEN